MNALILIYLFFMHFVADFLLQSRAMGKGKSENLWLLLAHISIQFIVIGSALVWISVKQDLAAEFAVLNAVIHGVIDWFIWRLYKISVVKRGYGADFAYQEDSLFYSTIGFDQFLHIATIAALAHFFFQVRF